MNKFYIQTLGCRLNQAESEELAQKLLTLDWQLVSDPTQADLIVINGCVVTHKAERESRQVVRRLRRLNPRAQLVAVGCWGEKVKRLGGRVPEGIDYLIGNQDKWQELLAFIGVEPKPIQDLAQRQSGPGRGLIWIQKGCSNQCSYCLTRLVRRTLVSKPAEQVIAEINQALKAGAQEIVLTGQNLSQYWYQGWSWIDLVALILEKTPVGLLRLGSINPLLVEFGPIKRTGFQATLKAARQLVALYQGLGRDRLARHLHLSCQSGSDRVLALMGRNYRRRHFEQVARVLQAGVPGINLTTDIIVGFPGETETDFQETLDLVRKVAFGKIHIFRYSTRQGTLAAERESAWGRVTEGVKRERAQQLSQLEQRQRRRFWRRHLGQELSAIIWPQTSQATNQGLTDNYLPFRLVRPLALDRAALARVKLVALDQEGLKAELVEFSQSQKR